MLISHILRISVVDKRVLHILMTEMRDSLGQEGMMIQRRGHGGRPKTREADPGEKITISVRITQEMKQRLEETAAATGRSQSQEVELRLDRSFDREDLL